MSNWKKPFYMAWHIFVSKASSLSFDRYLFIAGAVCYIVLIISNYVQEQERKDQFNEVITRVNRLVEESETTVKSTNEVLKVSTDLNDELRRMACPEDTIYGKNKVVH